MQGGWAWCNGVWGFWNVRGMGERETERGVWCVGAERGGKKGLGERE